MPHIVIEHSRGLEHSHDLQGLCDTLWKRLAGHGSVSGPETVRTRTIAASAGRSGGELQSFAHAELLLIPGRSDETRAELAQMVLDVLVEMLPDVGSLTVRLGDLNPPYLKRML